MKTLLAVLTVISLGLSSFAHSSAKITDDVYQWTRVEDEARLVWVDDRGGMIIFFSKVNGDQNCDLSYGLITASSMKLGAYIKSSVAKSSKNKLNVVIAGEEYTGRTAMAQYSNGVEVQMTVEDGFLDFGRESLAEQFGANNSFSVQFGSKDPILKDIRHRGFSEIIGLIKRNCSN